MHTDETIVAIASAKFGHQRGIVRISGPRAGDCVENIFMADAQHRWRTVRRATSIPGQAMLPLPLGNVPCTLYWWPDCRSYTRQPTAEFHTFGAGPLLDAITQAVCRHGARLARPGEFTLRAFLAGRIDLPQAEAILGVIDAVDERQLTAALTQLAGGLSQPLGKLRHDLMDLCADLEAGLDFVEEDISFITSQEIISRLEAAQQLVSDLLQQFRQRHAGDALPRVVLWGRPNVGKSSLWNALVDGHAIVTDRAGTTRDYLTATVHSSLQPFTLIDTAGVAAESDTLSSAAGDKTREQTELADLLLLCFDSTRPLDPGELEMREIDAPHLVVLTKVDQPRCSQLHLQADIESSATRGFGLQELILACGQRLHSLRGEANVVSSTATRCRESVVAALAAIQRAHGLAKAGEGDELIAADVRDALDQLGDVLGVVYTDDILDRIFSRFCIGK